MSKDQGNFGFSVHDSFKMFYLMCTHCLSLPQRILWCDGSMLVLFSGNGVRAAVSGGTLWEELLTGVSVS